MSPSAGEPPHAGRVVKLYSDFADVAWDPLVPGRPPVETARLRGRLERERGQRAASLAVGDRVVLALEGDQPVIEEVRPRRTELTRRDPRHPDRERVVATNVDRVLACASAELPPLAQGLVDRHLVAASVAGLEGAVALTKCDLVTPEIVDALAAPWRLAGIPVHALGLGDAEALSRLRTEWLEGFATVLVGASGVGKSTLRNALLPAERVRAATAEVSPRSGQGRHRTSAATFEPLPPSGYLVDTPGVREFGLARLESSEVARHFPEVADGACRFADCRHESEPGCAVLEAYQAGRLHSARLESLRAIRDALEEAQGRLRRR